ncbi:TIGR02680 family protein [Nocardia vinacea]|uniref:TIGR02680 family protein n=1 Tax=Nocardia vinacea TaxID=96468 RepID=UPI0033D5668A
MTTGLPSPHRERWQPLRAGLVDLFYYDVEEFWFRDGRLLLRGNNGAGKSKVLALLLPFLLDGELAAHRVEPDADPKKRMEWNLLLGGAHPHPERIGYTWLEFGRRDVDGTEQFCTIGCGLKAVSGKGIAAHWFFVSAGRVGPDFRLLDRHGSPLSRDRLAEALGEYGRRYDRAREYRSAVDEALFGLGEQRYGALVDLLIRLRQPQLSKRPSEKALSAALTESLPPLGQAILADVAEAFRSLAEDREELADMREAMVAAQNFLAHYHRYAQVATRRRCAAPRIAHSKYEKLSAGVGEATRRLTEAEATVEQMRSTIEDLDDAHTRLTAHRTALYDSDAMDAARQLEDARTQGRRLAEAAVGRARERDDAEAEADERQGRYDDAERELETARVAFGRNRTEVTEHAERAGIGTGHDRDIDSRLAHMVADLGSAAGSAATAGSGSVVASASAPSHANLRSASELRTAATTLVNRQDMAIKHVRTLIDRRDQRARELAAARVRIDEIDGQLSEVAARRTEADDSLDSEVVRLLAAARTFTESARELTVPDLHTVLDELRDWGATLDGDNPFTAAVTRRAATVIDALARADTAAAAAETEQRSRLGELVGEMARLEAGEVAAPPTRYTTDPAAREHLSGAPLWRLVDFADSLAAEERAGLEAAMEASGVLDAWVTPDGNLRDGGDLLVSAAQPAPGTTLAEVLRPAIDLDDTQARALDAQTVAAVLAAIGFGADAGHHTWVDTGGRFRIGVLHGAWRKTTAQYVGAGAREQARRRRLAELRAEIATVTTQLDQVTDERRVLLVRRATLDAELATLPSEAGLRAAHRAVAALLQQHLVLTDSRTQAQTTADAAEQARLAAESELIADAADAALPIEGPALNSVADHLIRYHVATEQLWSATDATVRASTRVGESRTDAERAAVRLAELTQKAAEEQRAALAAEQRHTTMLASVGAEVAELERALSEAEDAIRDNRRRYRETGAALESGIEAHGVAKGEHNRLVIELESARADRGAATESLRRFAHTGLLEIAVPDIDIPDPGQPWAPNPAVQLARTIEAALESVDSDDKVWERLQRRVTDEHKSLGDVLSRQGNSTSAQLLEDGIVIDVLFRGKTVTVVELAATLAGEVADRGRLLTEREREILENHLVNEVASSLQELIFAAEAQVAQMNRELDSRPTSTGMRLMLGWEPGDDAPDGAAAAQRQLRQTADAWNEADRAAVGAFLQHEIERVRAAQTGGTWLDHLTEALDYRRWNKFTIKRQQNGQWRPATGPASGGEGALVASVPLFAAAAAHYASAGNPHAPRLVTLDEAFAGVDDDARAKYLGLLAAFDLDVVMTSEREWGCYPEVPGLAIAQLARADGIPAVLVTNWEWDGRVRSQVPRPTLTLATPVSEPAAAEDDQRGLWS